MRGRDTLSPMSHTLQEVASITGKPYAVIKKHAQRGKLGTIRDGRSVLVTEDQLALYQSAEALDGLSDAVRARNGTGTPALIEAGNVIARLPSPVLNAILEGMPLTGKPKPRAGGPEPFREISKTVAHKAQVPEPTDDDPHGSKPIGSHGVTRRAGSGPATRRGACGVTWTWNGLLWEGGGSAEGRQLGEGITPASPYSHLRPSSPPRRAHG